MAVIEAREVSDITSTQKAVDEGRNCSDTASLTTSDIQNRDNFNASGSSLSGGDGKPAPNLAGGVNGAAPGIASASGKNSSTTTGGISGTAGDKEVRTRDASGGLAKTFDADKVNKEVAAQLQITSTFGQQAAKAGGEYANGKAAELRAQGNEAEAANWDEGGAYRVAMHTVLAGLTGGMQGVLGAASSQMTIDAIGKQVAATDLPLGLKTALVAAAGTVVGAAVGGETSAAAGFNATANNYLTSTDLKNRDQKIKGCQANGDTACEVRVLREYDLKSAANTGELQRNTLVERVSLEQTRADLKTLLQDASVSEATKAQARVSIQEVNTAINVIDKAPVLKDAFTAGLLMADVITLSGLAASETLTSTIVKEFIAARTGVATADEVAARIANNFYRDGAAIPQALATSSGIVIKAVEGKTTTVLGSYAADTKNIIELQVGYPKTMDFTGAVPSGFNMLNVPDNYAGALFKSGAFWSDVNRPFLEAAMLRGDEIYLATKPTEAVLNRVTATGQIDRSGFGKEYDFLKLNGYSYDAKTGKMLKGIP